MNAIAAAWYRTVAVALARLHYRRVTLIGREHLPPRGPVLYVALHRNGAIDGAVYAAVVPRLTFLIAARLRRSALGGLIFGGLTVERAADAADAGDPGARAGNAASLDRAAAHVAAGNALLVFPEGTSDLGPRHLPFQTGAARIAEAALNAQPGVAIVPLGVFYLAPECVRSDVVVVAGPPLDTRLAVDLAPRARAAELYRRIAAALKALAVEAPDADALARIERLAALRADGDGAAYHAALTTLAREGLPPHARDAWADVSVAVDRRELARDGGAPAISRRGPAWSALWLGAQLPLVAAAALLNLGPVLAAAASARRADARNTVALFRAIGALLALVPWAAATLAACVLAGRPALWLGYVALTGAGLALYPELRRRAALLRSARAARRLRPAADAALRAAFGTPADAR